MIDILSICNTAVSVVSNFKKSKLSIQPAVNERGLIGVKVINYGTNSIRLEIDDETAVTLYDHIFYGKPNDLIIKSNEEKFWFYFIANGYEFYSQELVIHQKGSYKKYKFLVNADNEGVSMYKY